MQILRDAAALAILLLLALTVRIETHGTKLDLELGTPVEAAFSTGPATQPTDETDHNVEFSERSQATWKSAELSRWGALESQRASGADGPSHRTILIARPEVPLRMMRELNGSWLRGIWRIELAPAPSAPPEPTATPRSCPCDFSSHAGSAC